MTLSEVEHASLLRLKGPTIHTSPYLAPLSRVAETAHGKVATLQRNRRSRWRRLTERERETERRILRRWARRRGVVLTWDDLTSPGSPDAGRPAYIGRRFVGWKI